MELTDIQSIVSLIRSPCILKTKDLTKTFSQINIFASCQLNSLIYLANLSRLPAQYQLPQGICFKKLTDVCAKV